MATYIAEPPVHAPLPKHLCADPVKAAALWTDLTAAKTVVIMMHRFPDPDAICSAFVLGELLEREGIRVHYLSSALPDNFAERFSYIEGIERIATELPPDVAAMFDGDYASDPNLRLVAVDAANRGLLGHPDDLEPTHNIDHHEDNPRYAPNPANNWVDGKRISVTEILAQLIGALGNVEFTPELSRLLLLGMLSDSAMMASPGVTDRTCETLEFLIGRVGKEEYAKVAHAISAHPGVQSLHVIGAGLQKRVIWASGKARFALITTKMLKKLGATTEQGRSLVNYLIRGAEIAATFMQEEDGVNKFHASCRSIHIHDVSAIVRSIIRGAGGHKNAAGLSGTLKDCLHVFQGVATHLRNHAHAHQSDVEHALPPAQIAADAELAKIWVRTNGWTSNVEQGDFHRAAELLKSGGSLARVAQRQRSLSEEVLDIVADAFKSAEITSDGSVVSTCYPAAPLDGSVPVPVSSDVRRLITQEMMLAKTEFAVLFSDSERSGWDRVATIRAAPGADLGQLALDLGFRRGRRDVLTVHLRSAKFEPQLLAAIHLAVEEQRTASPLPQALQGQPERVVA